MRKAFRLSEIWIYLVEDLAITGEIRAIGLFLDEACAVG